MKEDKVQKKLKLLVFIDIFTVNFTSDKEKFVFAKDNCSLHKIYFFGKVEPVQS